MDEQEARRRFAGARVARLSTVGPEGRPHLVPVVFAVRGDEIVTAVDQKPKRGARLRRLRNIEAVPAVCLLVDHYEDEWERLWWVRADGDARVVPAGEAEEAVAALRQKYEQYRRSAPDGPLIVITVRGWRGWRAA